MLATIIKVNADHLIGKMMDFFFVHPDFFSLCLKSGQLLIQLHTLGCGGAIYTLFRIGIEVINEVIPDNFTKRPTISSSKYYRHRLE